MSRVLAVGLVLVASSAWAGTGENALSLGGGYATYATPSDQDDEVRSPTVGAAATATFERGVSDYAAWRVRAVGAVYTSAAGTAGSGLVTLGLSYRVDVLKYVPYVAVGIGGLVRGGGPFSTGIEPALEIAGGIDWLRGRNRSLGIDLAMTGFASDTTTLAVTVRSTWRWGYF